MAGAAAGTAAGAAITGALGLGTGGAGLLLGPMIMGATSYAGGRFGDWASDKVGQTDIGKKAIAGVSDVVGKGAEMVGGKAAGEVARAGTTMALAANSDEERAARHSDLGKEATDLAFGALPGLGGAAGKLKSLGKYAPEIEAGAAKYGSKALGAVKGAASKLAPEIEAGVSKYGAKAIDAAKSVAGKAQQAYDAAPGMAKSVADKAASAVKATAGSAVAHPKITNAVVGALDTGADAKEQIDQIPGGWEALEQMSADGFSALAHDPRKREIAMGLLGAGATALAARKMMGKGNLKTQAKGAIGQATDAAKAYTGATAPVTQPAAAPAAEPQDRYLSRDAFRAKTKQGSYQPPKRVKPGQEPTQAVHQPYQQQQQAPAPSTGTTVAPATAKTSANAGHSQSLKKAKAQPTKASRRGNTKIRSPRKLREDIDLARLKNLAGIRTDDN